MAKRLGHEIAKLMMFTGSSRRRECGIERALEYRRASYILAASDLVAFTVE